MWKIFIEYDDKSKITLTGKHKDIPLRLALKYNLHVKHYITLSEQCKRIKLKFK